MAMKKNKKCCDPGMMDNRKGSKSDKSQSKGSKSNKNSKGK
jgi:hypothetical protein